MIKAFIPAVVLASALAAPAVSFAQSSAPLTRAQVRAQLVQLEKAGYDPAGGVSPYYPTRLQAAEARVAAQNTASNVDASVGNGALVTDASTSVTGTKQASLGS